MTLTKTEQEALNKVEGLKLYKVEASETVYYSREIWARDEDEARDKALDEITISDSYASDFFEVTDVEEIVEGE